MDQKQRDEYNAYRKNWRKRPEVIARERDKYLQKKYGITSKRYDELLAAQDHRCAICRKKHDVVGRQKYFHVDHIHGTNNVRGLLCHLCNTGLGAFLDTPELLAEASKYILAGEELTSV